MLEKEKSALSDEVEHMKSDFVELMSRDLSLKKELKLRLNELLAKNGKLEDRARKAEEEVLSSMTERES